MNTRILIADDDHFYRKLMIELFDKEGYELVTAINGNDAASFLTTHEFDLVILDYHLPGQHGREILEIIRQRGLCVPVIVVTADDSVQTEREIRSYGPAYLFIKPFGKEIFLQVVARIFTQERMNRYIRQK